MKDYPSLDPEQFTIAIAGFPNVGKSTLLSKITTASPEIKNYAFTTKGLNVGVFEYKFSRIQCVDTPGTLARIKENPVERLAILTRQYLARVVIYVYDATEPYPMKDQERLHKIVKDEGHEMVCYLSKTDILPKDVVSKFKETHPEVLTSPADVKKFIKEQFDAWM
ncbi:GTP-binding protein [Candidatus Woesearchaeota archaeon]|nr:GTP-binding protein [Candidatus Woesearchaeota archaeon]